MKRILLFCSQDWQVPEAGRAEHYCFQVFSRLAQQGYQISWLCQERLARRQGEDGRRSVEVAEGIQLARLGLPIVYPLMAGMLLSRMAKTGRLEERYDVVVDCVKSRPMRIPDTVIIPVTPLVFHLSRRTPVSADPPGPFVAASHRGWAELRAAGAEDKHIVYAPHGVDPQLFMPAPSERRERPMMAAVEDKPRALLAALREGRRVGEGVDLVLVGRKKPWRGIPGMEYAPALTPKEQAHVFQQATIGFCGVGREHEAPAMRACGLPVIAPDTMGGREFVHHGQTGMLYTPGSRASIEEQVQTLMSGVTIRANGRANAGEQTTWDQTTQAIRTVIELA